jgi:multidrug efflux pump subunit AcrA (membrane-fusion protein)
MRNDFILDLADCTEFRQAIQARPAKIVHGTLVLLVALLGTALSWAATTQADLVIRAPGRVRPVATPVKVVNAARGEVLSASSGGRVVAVNFRAGDTVRRGDVLIRLETERLDNQIDQQGRAIRAGEEELTKLGHLDELLSHQYGAARAKAEAELAQAKEALQRAQERQAAEGRLAEVALKAAVDEEVPLRKLLSGHFVAPTEVTKAASKTREARVQLEKARIPVDEGNIQALHRALDLVARDYEVKREELELRRGTRRAEVVAARLELGKLTLERKHAVLLAPLDGIVTTGDVKVGDVLETGKAVVEIAQQAGFRFEATVPSEEVAHLRVGLPARIKLDAYDYQRYGTLDGTVCFLSPDSEIGQGQKLATYTVRIALPCDVVGRGDLRGRVKLGMSGQVEIITDRERLLKILVRRIRRTISLG